MEEHNGCGSVNRRVQLEVETLIGGYMYSGSECAMEVQWN